MSITPPIGRRRRKKELRGEKFSDWERLRADAYVTKNRRFVPYHYCFFWSFAKRLLLRRMRRKIVFSIEKIWLTIFFFLLLSFRSKMRMIEVFVFWDAGSEKGKGGIVWNNCGQPMIKQIAVVVPQVVGICVNIFSRMNESCVWKQKTFLFFFLSSSSSW